MTTNADIAGRLIAILDASDEARRARVRCLKSAPPATFEEDDAEFARLCDARDRLTPKLGVDERIDEMPIAEIDDEVLDWLSDREAANRDRRRYAARRERLEDDRRSNRAAWRRTAARKR